jgi:hypothetical protein
MNIVPSWRFPDWKRFGSAAAAACGAHSVDAASILEQSPPRLASAHSASNAMSDNACCEPDSVDEVAVCGVPSMMYTATPAIVSTSDWKDEISPEQIRSGAKMLAQGHAGRLFRATTDGQDDSSMRTCRKRVSARVFCLHNWLVSLVRRKHVALSRREQETPKADMPQCHYMSGRCHARPTY